MLTIRLQRAGKKNKPEYRVVLADKTAAAQKKFTEILGSYNPHTKALNIRSQERLNYWMDEQHVPLSATVQNLFVTKEIIKGTKTKAFTIPKKEAELDASAEESAAEEVKEDAVPAETEAPVSEVTEAPTETSTEETPAEAPAETTPEVVADAPTETPAEEAPAEEAPAAEESSKEEA